MGGDGVVCASGDDCCLAGDELVSGTLELSVVFAKPLCAELLEIGVLFELIGPFETCDETKKRSKLIKDS